ncbi:hypothetical protein DMH04_52360 [Kibdelosporangium aridum]|uniref:FXSXX-COOH protein n=1 Tax=Kibdelosporangium aridum TaxID=2030 RepID=A0A428Y8I5_KIBAR|nr:hypothetical protein [Kibdelosporangium aridum]RSM63867.1 hypothetical protein DMH04_52360 [Kibdelosporangium aridum]
MNTLSADPDEGITSELIDLDAVPLPVLRALDNAELRRSLRHVVEQTGHPRMAAGGDCSAKGRID